MADSKNVTSMRRVTAVTCVLTYPLLAKLTKLGIIIDNEKGLFLDIVALQSIPYTLMGKRITFLYFWMIVQQVAIIYLLYRAA